MLLNNHSHSSQTLALECERLRGTGSSAGIAETVADMSQAFFSAADTHASLGHMPMACSMCVFTAIQAVFAHLTLSLTPEILCRCLQLGAQLRACNFFTDAAAAYLRAAQ